MKRLVRLSAALVVAAGLVAAATPWPIPRATVAGAIAAGFVRTSGLDVTIAGPATLKLLPRPRLQAADLSVKDRDGAVLLDVPVLKAELDIPSLLGGAWRITSATLVEPTATVDLDRMSGGGLASAVGAGAPPLQMRLRSGILRTRSASGLGDLLATGIDATATWPGDGDGDGVVVSGVATVRGTTAHFAGDLQHPSLGITPKGSPATLQIDSPLFGFIADGVLSGGAQEQFAGRASLTAASLPHLMRLLGGIPLAITATRAQISGDLVARPHDVSLSNALLKLDRGRFEGTLAWRRDSGRSLVAGTLATDALDVDALSGDDLNRQALEDLYRRPLASSPLGTDLDLRISATTARIGRVVLADAAVAVLVRGDRLELTLDEAQAYGGLVKARALATLGPAGIDAHAELSATRLDLAHLSDDLTGRERVAGALTGHAAVDGRGASLKEVVAKLVGDGQIGIEDGRLAGLSLAQALRRLGRRMPLDADRRGTPTTFDKAQWDMSIKDGIVRIPDGKLTAPGIAMAFGAETDLPDGHIDVRATAAQTDGSGAPLRNGQSMPFAMRGSWTGPLMLIGPGGGLPAMAMPLFDGLSAER